MAKRKLTEWFGTDTKPEIIGVYRTHLFFPGAIYYQHWDGKFWSLYARTPIEAFNYRDSKSRFQEVMWRGLAEKP